MTLIKRSQKFLALVPGNNRQTVSTTGKNKNRNIGELKSISRARAISAQGGVFQ
jgi:hypothetical protein